MMLLYSLGLTLALVVSSPWWLLRMATTERYREGMGQRLGRVAGSLKAAVAGRQVVWLHAVSVGEVLAATRLVAELEEALGAEWVVVVSTTTRTGQGLAQQRFGAERVFYMPLDFGFAVRAYLDVLQPAGLVLMESELWPRMLEECSRRGVPVVVANARVSDRSFRRGSKLRVVWGRALRKVTLWLAQSEEDARRLVAMGARVEAVRVAGNLKYDVRAVGESWVAGLIRVVAAGRPVVVAGSTVASTEQKVASEEALVLDAWMKGALPLGAMLVLAPRHPERFSDAWELAYDFPALRATDLLAGKTGGQAVQRDYPEGESLDGADIILLDTIGDLAAVYGIADAAFVGGSLFPRGGHNPLEPAQFGVPVVIGSSYENFRDIVGKMAEAEAIRIVEDELELTEAFEELLTDTTKARAMGERGRQVFLSQQGATGRCVEAVLKLVRP